MDGPLFGEALARRLVGEWADENGCNDPSLDGVGGTGVAKAPAHALGLSEWHCQDAPRPVRR